MRTTSLALSLLLSLPAAVLADDVYLTNGRVFEGVIAEETETQVRIRMAGGVVAIPRGQVLRLEKGESPLAEYLRRKESLERAPDAGAAGWLELARWARAQKLEPREAALRAARIDPRLPGLAPLLLDLGYVLDEELGRWVPYAESMRRRGLVLVEGEWISREQYADRLKVLDYERARDLDAARKAREERVVERRYRELERRTRAEEEEARRQRERFAVFSVYPVWIVPGFVVLPPSLPPDLPPGGEPEPPSPPERPGFGPDAGRGTFTRIPGSLVPGSLIPAAPAGGGG